jgi:hypothetical protein
MELILKEAPRLLLAAVRRRDVRLFGLAADLAVPPLALVALLIAVAFLFGLSTSVLEAIHWPLGVTAVSACLLVVAVVLAWRGWGRGSLSLASLLLAPAYGLSKIPLYARFLTRRQKDWIKTERD